MREQLALYGGTPVRTRGWPTWPQASPAAEELLRRVLASGRWAISGRYSGTVPFERRFAAAFAEYTGTAYCVPTASGTASLMVGLEACGVGASDEVVIPGLTWVANASAVAGVNAIPVPVDVDPVTFCMDPAAVEAVITPRTGAIVAVHLYSALADLDALAAIATKHSLALIEDAAQAHGARYRGRPVGSFGDLSTFSMQHSKVMTCGEGGAVTTDRPDLARAIEQLRADGRIFAETEPAIGDMQLIEAAELMGSNRCMSEFHAALLLDQLSRLDCQNELRQSNAARLDKRLADLGLAPQQTCPATSSRTYYAYAVRLGERALEADPDFVCQALGAELGTPVSRTYVPLNTNPLYAPASRRRFAAPDVRISRGLADVELPVAESIHVDTLTLDHPVLLGTPEDMDDIAEAFAKVLSVPSRSGKPSRGGK